MKDFNLKYKSIYTHIHSHRHIHIDTRKDKKRSPKSIFYPDLRQRFFATFTFD